MAEFVRITSGRRVALVHPMYAEAVADALLEEKGCEPAGLAGRWDLQRFSYDGATGLVRRYRRGGAIARILGDAYVGVNRPLKELTLHIHVHEHGLSVPEPLGACWEKSGVFYRGKFATAQISATNLFEFLSTMPANAEAALERCGALIRRMHDIGVYHADLQLRNLLISGDDTWIVDFDNASIHHALGNIPRARNLLRLRRSIDKSGYPDELFAAALRGYGRVDLPAWLSRAYAVKGALSDLVISRRTP